jgi:hypothetical protein
MASTTIISREQVLAALNAEFDFAHRHHSLARLDGRTLAASPSYKQATREFTLRLRQHVDSWLETGKNKDGTDTPRKRFPTNEMWQIVHNYMRAHPAFPHFGEKGFTAAVNFSLKEFGGATRDKGSRVQTLPGVGQFRTPSGQKDRPIPAAIKAAETYFVSMLFSEWAFRITRCIGKCGRYYVLNKPVPFYKRGTLCRRCNSRASALRLTSEARTSLRRKLCDLVGRLAKTAIAKDRLWYRDAQLKARIVNKGNSSLKREHPGKKQHLLTSKWITRNRQEIEALVRMRP